MSNKLLAVAISASCVASFMTGVAVVLALQPVTITAASPAIGLPEVNAKQVAMQALQPDVPATPIAFRQQSKEEAAHVLNCMQRACGDFAPGHFDQYPIAQPIPGLGTPCGATLPPLVQPLTIHFPQPCIDLTTSTAAAPRQPGGPAGMYALRDPEGWNWLHNRYRPFEEGAEPIESPEQARKRLAEAKRTQQDNALRGIGLSINHAGEIVIGIVGAAVNPVWTALTDGGDLKRTVIDDTQRLAERINKQAVEDNRAVADADRRKTESEEMQQQLDQTQRLQEQRDRAIEVHGVDPQDMNGFNRQLDDGSFELDASNLPDVDTTG